MYWVSKVLVYLYILKKGEIWSGDTDASQTDRQTTEDRATQLLYSIQFKLSHAIELKHCFVPDDGDLVNDWTVEVNQLLVMRANCLVLVLFRLGRSW